MTCIGKQSKSSGHCSSISTSPSRLKLLSAGRLSVDNLRIMPARDHMNALGKIAVQLKNG